MTKNCNQNSYDSMSIYNTMPAVEVPPYSMLINPRSFVSERVNTDQYGFRKTFIENEILGLDDYKDFPCVNILLGGSTAFGVGATNDTRTIASYLSQLTKTPWLNLGVRGAVSFQEYIYLVQNIANFQSVGKILILSGINDLYRNMIDSHEVYYDKRFAYQNDYLSFHSPRRIALTYLKSIFLSKTVDQLLRGESKNTVSEFNSQKALRLFETQFRRNFLLYAALGKYRDIDITFSFQPFFQLAKSVGTAAERAAVEHTNYLQRNTNWSTVRDRMLDNYEIAVKLLAESTKTFGLKFFDCNDHFDDDLDYFVDNVHLTDEGNKRVAELYFDLVN